MRFGEILAWDTKDKAKVGERYVFSDKYKAVADIKEHGEKRILDYQEVTVDTLECTADRDYPFYASNPSVLGTMFQFALEVLEDEPKYRPYESCDEMKDDYKQRFNVRCGDNPPFIWVVDKETEAEELIITFGKNVVRTGIGRYLLKDIFEKAEYLDHTPCGKRIDI